MATTASDLAEPAVPKGHPIAFWFFYWGEFAERSSFYGMRTILLVYMTEQLKMSDDTAGTAYYWFKMACYFLPLVGGYVADRFFGRYWTIVGFSIPYVLGHFLLGIESTFALFAALVLLAGGSGVIKPNISTLLGQTYDQQRPGQEQLRSAAFMWFYLAINIGALISTLLLPVVRKTYGFAIAFQVPAWLMVGALITFALGKPYYAVESAQRLESTPEEKRARRQTLAQLFGVFALIVFFWVAYEHNDSLWLYFIRDYVNLNVWWSDAPLAPEQLQFINPLFVMILVPTFNVLFKAFDPQQRVFTAAVKMTMGFFCTAAAVGMMSAAGFQANAAGPKVALAWPIAAYIMLTAGEVLVYGTGLDLAYSVAPKNMKGFVTACFLVTNTLGNFINTGLIKLYGGSLTEPVDQRGMLPPGSFFAMSAVMVVIAGVIFYFVGRRITKVPQPVTT